MQLIADTHTHTIASGHAYSTLADMLRAGAEKGLQAVAITDHGPAMPDGAYDFHFQNTRVWPEEMYGVKLLPGAEVNIRDTAGTLDLPDGLLKQLTLNVASLHPPTFPMTGIREDSTKAYIAAMANPHIHVLGHPDDSRFPVDFEEMARAATDTGTLLEVNNNSLRPGSFRVGARDNCVRMLECCVKHGAMVTVASDAHIDIDVGNFTYALALLEETGFPESLVATASLERLMDALNQKHK